MKNKEFEKIVNMYSKKLYNYLLKFHKNKEDAEDILQTTFIDFFEKAKRTKIEYPSAYLFRTAHNKSINLKKKNGKVTVLDTVNYSETKNYEDDIMEKSKNKEIREVLSELSPKYLLAIELKYFQKKKYREMAEIMELSESAVESILVRARKKIKKRMQDFVNPDVLKNRKNEGGEWWSAKM